MSKYRQGQIVWARVPDAAGGNPKERPAVVLTATQRIQAGEPLTCVAVTTTFPHPLPPDHVLLPHHPAGMVRTRLKEPSAAVCRWLVSVHPDDVLDVAGVVPPREWRQIVSILQQQAEQGQEGDPVAPP